MSDKPKHDLELDAGAMRRSMEAVLSRVIDHVGSLPDQPAGYRIDPEAVARRFAEDLPEKGSDLDGLLDRLFNEALPVSFNTAGPGYLAYIPGGGLFESALAEFLAAATNRYVGVWQAAPALAQIETSVILWLARIVGLPPSARGVLTTGGSMANFTAIVTARRAMLPEDFRDGVIYVGDQVHHSVTKAALLAGFAESQIVSVTGDAAYRIDVAALERAMTRDADLGLRPFLIVGSAGTTNSGAVDDLQALADVAARRRCWFHVDAAYGGFFCLTEHGRTVMRGIERADSVTLDPHKGLFLPYGTGALLVRDGEALRRAHAVHADYLPAMQRDDEEFPRLDFCDLSMELSRDFRGLRVWLPVKLHGIGVFRATLQEKLDLTALAHELLLRIPGVIIAAAPRLSIVAFRFERPEFDGPRNDELNRDVLRRVLDVGRVWITPTTLGGRFTLRICVLSFRTHRDRLEEGLAIITAAARDALAAADTRHDREGG